MCYNSVTKNLIVLRMMEINENNFLRTFCSEIEEIVSVLVGSNLLKKKVLNKLRKNNLPIEFK